MVRIRPVVCESGPKGGAPSEGGPAESRVRAPCGGPDEEGAFYGRPRESRVRAPAGAPTMKEGQRASCSRRGSAREELGAPGATANRSRGEGQGVEILGGPSRQQAGGWSKESRPSETPPAGDCNANLHRAKPVSGSPKLV